MTTYRIQIYSNNKYETCWQGNNYETAMKMIDKPYYRRYTRRLSRIQEEIIWTTKKDKWTK